MKNVSVCNNCGSENPYYALNCKKCNSFIRSKVSNIDLWETTWRLFESPIKATEKIIFSETKNFLITLLFFICVKYALNATIIHNAFGDRDNPFFFSSQGFMYGSLPVVILLVVFSFVMTLMNKILGIGNRFRDNFAIYIYSFIPQLFGLVVLTPIQYALFGEYWFLFNPSPFLIKPMASIVLFILEGILFIWSGILFVTSTYCQTRNKRYSVIAGFIFSLLIGLGLYLTALIK
jgi:hypothetical protein